MLGDTFVLGRPQTKIRGCARSELGCDGVICHLLDRIVMASENKKSCALDSYDNVGTGDGLVAHLYFKMPCASEVHIIVVLSAPPDAKRLPSRE